jgi:molybdopterin/thiamine biosynthesis adenylyltransferase
LNKLVIGRAHWEKAKEHLLRADGEHFAFFLCGVAESYDGISFLVSDFVQIQDTAIKFAKGIGFQLDLEILLHLTNRARSERLALVEAHSHPWSKTGASFSTIDLAGLKEFVPYILEDLPGSPYAATVWGQKSVDGLCWKSSVEDKAFLGEVRVIGDTLFRIATTSELHQKRKRLETSSERASRQVLMIGEQGQEYVRQTRVAIIGLGGLGSHIAQMLAYLGVRNFILVDFDKVDITNLNRLIGAGPKDVGKAKVEIAERMIERIASKGRLAIRTFKSDLREQTVLDALKTADVIFGCVDKDGPRLILNELSLAYLIPYIDCGFGINAENYEIQEAGGRVILVRPDGPCLLCCKEISTSVASDDLAPPEEFDVRKSQGYVSGVDVPSPSVVSLNGTVASVAVTEFLALVTGFRPARTYTFYDMLEQRMVPRRVKPDPKCIACSVKGLGDKANVKRYAQTQIPRDIPALAPSRSGND